MIFNIRAYFRGLWSIFLYYEIFYNIMCKKVAILFSQILDSGSIAKNVLVLQ